MILTCHLIKNKNFKKRTEVSSEVQGHINFRGLLLHLIWTFGNIFHFVMVLKNFLNGIHIHKSLAISWQKKWVEIINLPLKPFNHFNCALLRFCYYQIIESSVQSRLNKFPNGKLDTGQKKSFNCVEWIKGS